MKFNKIAALLLASSLFMACSDDDDVWNNSEATVSMGKTEIAVKENKGLFNVPLQVEGTLNGAVRVTVEVAESGANPAMEDIHYLVTQKTVLIPAEATSGNIEISTVDDQEINDPRTFTVTITKVEGAKIGQSTTTVTLRDNDAAFYEKLQGVWKLSGVDGKGQPVSFDVKLHGFEEGEEGYDQILILTGFMDADWTQAVVQYAYDKQSQKVKLSFVLGTMMASGVNFGPAGINDVYLGSVTPDGRQPVLDGTVDGESNADLTEVTFAPDLLVFWVVQPGSNTIIGNAGVVGNIKIVKK